MKNFHSSPLKMLGNVRSFELSSQSVSFRIGLLVRPSQFTPLAFYTIRVPSPFRVAHFLSGRGHTLPGSGACRALALCEKLKSAFRNTRTAKPCLESERYLRRFGTPTWWLSRAAALPLFI